MHKKKIALLLALGAFSMNGFAQSMNPDTSVSVLTLYRQSKRQGEAKAEAGGGLSLQEAELQFLSDVDPYLKASVLLSVHPEDAAPAPTPAPATAPAAPSEPGETSYAVEPEEVFLETTKVPVVTLKLGRFHAAVGRHNGLHTHAYPFIDAPLINQRLLGGDGLTEIGASAAALVPAPWFVEFTAQALAGDSPALFASDSTSDVAEVLRLRNLIELSDSSTLDLGLSKAHGANFYHGQTNVGGADLTFKWRPAKGGKYTAVTFAGEYLQGEVEGRPTDSRLRGFATWVQYQFAERWWAEVRTEKASDLDANVDKKKVSALVGFFPSEFSGFRLQVDRQDDGDGLKPLQSFALQSNIVIGAHPAHSY